MEPQLRQLAVKTARIIKPARYSSVICTPPVWVNVAGDSLIGPAVLHFRSSTPEQVAFVPLTNRGFGAEHLVRRFGAHLAAELGDAPDFSLWWNREIVFGVSPNAIGRYGELPIAVQIFNRLIEDGADKPDISDVVAPNAFAA